MGIETVRGNFISCERQSSRRILYDNKGAVGIETLREVTSALQRGGHGHKIYTRVLPDSSEVLGEKEKQLVFVRVEFPGNVNRPADGISADPVAIGTLGGPRAVAEKICSVQILMAIIVVSRAVKFRGSRLRHNDHLATAHAAILSLVVAGQ